MFTTISMTTLYIEVSAHIIHIILDLLIKTQNNSVLLSHQRPARSPKLVEQGVTIYKLNDLRPLQLNLMFLGQKIAKHRVGR